MNALPPATTVRPSAGAPHGLWMFDVYYAPGRQAAHIPKTARCQGEALLRLINEDLLHSPERVWRIDCVAMQPAPERDAPQADAAGAQAQPEAAA